MRLSDVAGVLVESSSSSSSVVVGKGTYGRVHRHQCTVTGNVVAVKVISKSSKIPAPILEDIVASEVAALRAVAGNPHSVQFISFDEAEHEWRIQTEFAFGGTVADSFFLSSALRLRHCGGNPVDNVSSVMPNVNVVQTLVRQLLSSLANLHSKGLLHGDVKPENLLLRDAHLSLPEWLCDEGAFRPHLLLADFGCSTSSPLRDRGAASMLGTPMYLSPEAVSFARGGTATEVTTAHDVWAVGVIAFELLTLTRMFASRPGAGDSRNLIAKFATSTAFRTGLLDRVECPEARSFVRDLMAPSAKDRPTASSALHHPWLATAVAPCAANDAKFSLQNSDAVTFPSLVPRRDACFNAS